MAFPDHCTMQQKVGAVLVNWNTGGHTLRCIDSLLAGTIVPALVVVDNASTDDSVARIRRNHPDIEIIENRTNYGFTGGNNIGIRFFLDRNYEYVWLLNNDTIVDPRCLEELLRGFQGTDRVALTTGKIYQYNKPQVLWFAGMRWNKLTFRISHRGEGEDDRGQYDGAQATDFFDGCCALIKRDILREVGLLDEHFFAYHEDLDYSFRLRRRGYLIGYAPRAILWHHVGSSMAKNRSGSSGGTSSPVQYFLSQRNRLYLLRRYGSHLQQCFGITVIITYALYVSAALLALGRFAKIRAAWAGIYHGLTDEIGDIKTSPAPMPYA